jgi:hypothetical protein
MSRMIVLCGEISRSNNKHSNHSKCKESKASISLDMQYLREQAKDSIKEYGIGILLGGSNDYCKLYCNELKVLDFDPETKIKDCLNRAIDTGYLPIRKYDSDAFNLFYFTSRSMGIDPAYGSSAFGIVVTQWIGVIYNSVK